MSRSIWKGNFIDQSLIERQNSKKTLNIWSRNSVIPGFLEGNIVFVHNGKSFKKLKISREKVGFKFGFFVKTRNRISVEKLKKLKNKNKKK